MKIHFNFYTNNLAFKNRGGVAKPIYGIRAQDAKCIPFDSSQDGSTTLEIDKSLISRCLHNKVNAAQGYTFCYPHEILRSDSISEIDIEKLNKIFQRFYNTKNKPVYTLDKNHKHERFVSEKEAAEAIGYYSSLYISNKENGSYTVKSHVIIPAKNVERIVADGKIYTDEEAIEEYYQYFNYARERNEIYLIDRYENCEKYKGNMDASINSPYHPDITVISKCLNDKRYKTASNLAVVRASEIEIINEDGSIDIDRKKVKEIVERCFTKDRPGRKKKQLDIKG